MARTDPQVNLRIPASLKEKLEESAAASGRSITAEVIGRLEASYDKTQELAIESHIRTINEQVKYLLELAQRPEGILLVADDKALQEIAEQNEKVQSKPKAKARGR